MSSLGRRCSVTAACLAAAGCPALVLEVQRSPRTFKRPAAASGRGRGAHPPPSHSVMEIILVHFKVQKTPKECFPPLLKTVGSHLLSCIQNFKIILTHIELDLIDFHVIKLRLPKWWPSQDLCTPLSLSKPSRIPIVEDLKL